VLFRSLHPDDPEWETRLEDLWARGIRGIKLHPDFQGFRLDDPRLDPIVEALAGRFALLVHVGDRLPPGENPSCPITAARLGRRHPGLDLIVPHLGGYLHWDTALDHLLGLPVWIDTSSSLPFLDDAKLADIFRRHPRERLLFGSDYPIFDPETELTRLAGRLGLGTSRAEELAANAGRLFGPGGQYAPVRASPGALRPG